MQKLTAISAIGGAAIESETTWVEGGATSGLTLWGRWWRCMIKFGQRKFKLTKNSLKYFNIGDVVHYIDEANFNYKRDQHFFDPPSSENFDKDEVQVVVTSFEQAAGFGQAKTYTALALKPSGSNSFV
ncbi:hypothetical protein C5167_046303 [Papaver somniferum]|uniref:POX domain-containing protein n=1 Tax=Papaver somniferum TaxID=3469 RepID=A0A4Y7LH81_PAPSO|nr:hypothetical protein C5167_046303 [Papaver somniferum]